MIKPLDKYDTRAVVKITDWSSETVLERLKQYSVMEDSWFVREVLLGGDLHLLLEVMETQGNIKIETLSTYCNPSEKVRQIMKEEENLKNAN